MQEWQASTVKYTATANSAGEYVFEYTGAPVEMAVDSVTDIHGNLLAGSDYSVAYYVDNSNGKFDSGDVKTSVNGANDGLAPVNPGRYFIAVFDNGAEADLAGADSEAVVVESFQILPGNFDGVTAYECLDGAIGTNDVTTDTDFVYTGAAQQIGFAVDGKAIDPANYAVTWNTTAAQAGTAGAAPVAAGEYVANLVGKANTPYAGATASVKVTVGKFDLSKVVVSDISASTLATSDGYKSIFDDSTYLSYDGKPLAAGIVDQVFKFNSNAFGNTDGSTGTGTQTGILYVAKDGTIKTDPSTVLGRLKGGSLGTYTLSFAPDANEKDNYTGEQQLKFNVVTSAKTAADVTYDDVKLNDSSWTKIGDAIVLDASKDAKLDPSLFEISGLSQKDGDFSVSITKDGQEVTSYDEPGEYVATVSVKIPADFSVGGKVSQKFYVTNGEISADSVFLAVDGTNVSATSENSASSATTYDGEAANVSTVVKAGKTVLTEGEDYTVKLEVKDGAKYVEAESATDAGTYRVTVTPSVAFGGEDKAVQLYFSIGRLSLVKAVSADKDGIAYTGSAVTPSFVGVDADGNEFVLGKDDVDIKYYEGKLGTDGKTWNKSNTSVAYDKIVDAGVYYAEITLKSTSKNFTQASTNFDTASDSVRFDVVKSIGFADVAADAWYAPAVSKASSTGFEYMNGLAGTNLFLPLANITRAEVAQVFYNMAGGKANETIVKDNVFSDVNKVDWYAVAVNWASQAGIVSGYDGSDAFGATDNATREQVATMIYRYAKVQGKDVTVKDESAALAKYADGASVSDYAKTAMAYCVEQGVFGVDVDTLRPQDFMSRAEMAATSVRVQPEGAYTEL